MPPLCPCFVARACLNSVDLRLNRPTYVLPASVSILRLVHVKTQRSASDECCALDNVMFEAQGTRDCMISVLIRVARVGRKGRRPRPPNERRPHGEGIGALGVGMSGRRLLQARGIPASHPPLPPPPTRHSRLRLTTAPVLGRTRHSPPFDGLPSGAPRKAPAGPEPVRFSPSTRRPAGPIST